MNARSSRAWIGKQANRARRLFWLVPAMVDRPRRIPARCAKVVRIAILFGFAGVKVHFRNLEFHTLSAKFSWWPAPEPAAKARPRRGAWFIKQASRVRRLVALIPAMVNRPWRIPARSVKMARILFFSGFVGVKAHFKNLEFASWADKFSYSPNSDSAPIENVLGGPRTDEPQEGYIILAPPFVSNSAGIGCLYRLCHELRQRGHEAFVTGSNVPAPKWTTPLLELPEAIRRCHNGYVAVYPEIVAGNPLGAKTVVRWVLNRPGLIGGEEMYDPEELVFYYSDVFLPYIRNRICGKLYMPTIDEKIFFCNDDGQDSSERSLECFYLGKSKWKDGYIDRGRTFEITREMPAKSELGKLLRATRVLYCFDNSTILVYEALLCGCPVVIIPDGTQTKEDYAKLELSMDGIAWGMEERAQMKVNVEKLKKRYQTLKDNFAGEIDRLIALSCPVPASEANTSYKRTWKPLNVGSGS